MSDIHYDRELSREMCENNQSLKSAETYNGLTAKDIENCAKEADRNFYYAQCANKHGGTEITESDKQACTAEANDLQKSKDIARKIDKAAKALIDTNSEIYRSDLVNIARFIPQKLFNDINDELERNRQRSASLFFKTEVCTNPLLRSSDKKSIFDSCSIPKVSLVIENNQLIAIDIEKGLVDAKARYDTLHIDVTSTNK